MSERAAAERGVRVRECVDGDEKPGNEPSLPPPSPPPPPPLLIPFLPYFKLHVRRGRTNARTQSSLAPASVI